MNITSKVLHNEESFTKLFSKKIHINPHVSLYYDEYLKDMYDHNYFSLANLKEEEYVFLKEENNKYNQGHFKISIEQEVPFLINKGFMNEVILTMLKEDYLTFPTPINKDIEIKNIKDNSKIYDDLIQIEVDNYADEYGYDFTIRKMKRYLDKALRRNGLNFFAAYKDDKIVASCHTYHAYGVVMLDGLIVSKEYRHQKIATSLIQNVAKYYDCPIYLHAEKDDNPEMIYKYLGFKSIKSQFDYLLLVTKYGNLSH